MTKVANGILAYSFWAVLGGLAGLCFACIGFLFVGAHPIVGTSFIFASLICFTGIAACLIGLCLDRLAQELRDERARWMKHPLLTFDPHEKEPGYNRAVLGWFHEGPELRQPNDDFSRAFAARALVPPPVKKP